MIVVFFFTNEERTTEVLTVKICSLSAYRAFNYYACLYVELFLIWYEVINRTHYVFCLCCQCVFCRQLFIHNQSIRGCLITVQIVCLPAVTYRSGMKKLRLNVACYPAKILTFWQIQPNLRGNYSSGDNIDINQKAPRDNNMPLCYTLFIYHLYKHTCLRSWLMRRLKAKF